MEETRFEKQENLPISPEMAKQIVCQQLPIAIDVLMSLIYSEKTTKAIENRVISKGGTVENLEKIKYLRNVLSKNLSSSLIPIINRNTNQISFALSSSALTNFPNPEEKELFESKKYSIKPLFNKIFNDFLTHEHKTKKNDLDIVWLGSDIFNGLDLESLQKETISQIEKFSTKLDIYTFVYWLTILNGVDDDFSPEAQGKYKAAQQKAIAIFNSQTSELIKLLRVNLLEDEAFSTSFLKDIIGKIISQFKGLHPAFYQIFSEKDSKHPNSFFFPEIPQKILSGKTRADEFKLDPFEKILLEIGLSLVADRNSKIEVFYQNLQARVKKLVEVLSLPKDLISDFAENKEDIKIQIVQLKTEKSKLEEQRYLLNVESKSRNTALPYILEKGDEVTKSRKLEQWEQAKRRQEQAKQQEGMVNFKIAQINQKIEQLELWLESLEISSEDSISNNLSQILQSTINFSKDQQVAAKIFLAFLEKNLILSESSFTLYLTINNCLTCCFNLSEFLKQVEAGKVDLTSLLKGKNIENSNFVRKNKTKVFKEILACIESEFCQDKVPFGFKFNLLAYQNWPKFDVKINRFDPNSPQAALYSSSGRLVQEKTQGLKKLEPLTSFETNPFSTQITEDQEMWQVAEQNLPALPLNMTVTDWSNPDFFCEFKAEIERKGQTKTWRSTEEMVLKDADFRLLKKLEVTVQAGNTELPILSGNWKLVGVQSSNQVEIEALEIEGSVVRLTNLTNCPEPTKVILYFAQSPLKIGENPANSALIKTSFQVPLEEKREAQKAKTDSKTDWAAWGIPQNHPMQAKLVALEKKREQLSEEEVLAQLKQIFRTEKILYRITNETFEESYQKNVAKSFALALSGKGAICQDMTRIFGAVLRNFSFEIREIGRFQTSNFIDTVLDSLQSHRILAVRLKSGKIDIFDPVTLTFGGDGAKVLANIRAKHGHNFAPITKFIQKAVKLFNKPKQSPEILPTKEDLQAIENLKKEKEIQEILQKNLQSSKLLIEILTYTNFSLSSKESEFGIKQEHVYQAISHVFGKGEKLGYSWEESWSENVWEKMVSSFASFMAGKVDGFQFSNFLDNNIKPKISLEEINLILANFLHTNKQENSSLPHFQELSDLKLLLEEILQKKGK